MHRPLILVTVLAVALPAFAIDLGNHALPKPEHQTTPPPPDPVVLRQGGDTIADAVPLVGGPWVLTGTTAGYTNDYDEVCPYSGSTSPDVVYSLVGGTVDIGPLDLYGSDYDTKLYVYDQDLNLVACNDDFYDDYTSRIDMIPVSPGVTYYVVVDGYGGDSGDYALSIGFFDDFWMVDCPAGAVHEGEPAPADGYVDVFNGGCGSPGPDPVLQPIMAPVFCGVGGFFQADGGLDGWDTDWFTMRIPASGSLEIHVESEVYAMLAELGPHDCNEVGVLQYVEPGPGEPADLVIAGLPDAEVWVWFGPLVYTAPGYLPGNEFNYLLESNLVPVAVQPRSWTGVKALFD